MEAMNKLQAHHPHPEADPAADASTHAAAAPKRRESGQALVEYVLIIVLLAIGFGFALAFTGPAIGNVFNNVLYQFVGQDPSLPVDPLSDVGAPNFFWATVTWVAQNRQTETPFPTPITLPTLGGGPSGGGFTSTPTNTLTPTPSLTPTNTNTPTITLTPSLTPTHTYTPSPGPSPTPSDNVFNVPHVDQMGNPLWWRLGRSSLVEEIGSGVWSASYYDAISSASSSGWSFSGAVVGTGTLPSTADGGFSQNWGSGFPTGVGITNGDTWGISMTKTVTFPIAMRIFVSLAADDRARLFVNGTQVLADTSGGYNTTTGIVDFPAGTYPIRIDFSENTSNARLDVAFSRINNPDDTSQACAWDVVEDTGATPVNRTVSNTWMFAQNPASLTGSGANYTAGQSCILEMRGYVDLSTTTRALVSFWDYWELPSNVNATLQVANYVEVTPGAIPPTLNRPATTWQTIALRSGGTINHNWTRNEIDLSALGLGDKVTFRFVLTNTSGSTSSGTHRWFIEDLQVLNDPVPAADAFFTIDETWDLNDRTQMDDFIFDGETMRTLETTFGVPNQINGSSTWRWDLTSTRARSGTAWDDSPGYDHIQRMYTSSQPRVTFLEFKYPINVTSAYAPAADSTGNTGRPVLRFFTTYNVNSSASVQVEYAPASRNVTGVPSDAANPGNWTLVPVEGRLRRSGGCSPCEPNELSAADTLGLGFRQITVRLDRIPNWDTQPFRLRIALYNTNNSSTEGIYIDDISIVREAGGAFLAYPFTDDAENAGYTNTVWGFANGEWGTTNERGGYANTATAYTVRPGANYSNNSNTWMELNQWIDLNYDTPANIDNPGTIGEPLRSSGAAVEPILSFYHIRETNATTDFFSVDIWIEQTQQWYTIWRYDDNSNRGQSQWSRTNKTWERVEINLLAGISTALGKSITAITDNLDGQLLDDDIRVRFRFFADSSNNARGVFVDSIYIGDRNEITHKLWNAVPFGSLVTGSGDGIYEDRIELASRTLNGSLMWNPSSTPVQDRWFFGGTWTAVNDGAAYRRSGSLALTDTARDGFGNAVQYGFEEEHFLELRPVIDLRGTDPASRPMLTFWSRYEIGDDDRLRVQIASENTADLTQSHDKMAGWTRWEPARNAYTRPFIFNSAPFVYWHRVDNPTLNIGDPERRDTWQFYQVDLSSFVGNRIRVRFFLDSDHNTTLNPARGDGWYIDDVSVRFGFSEIISGMWSAWEDNGNNPSNWIFEGSWGLTNHYYNGSTSEALGAGEWRGFIYDCEAVVAANPALGIASWQCQDGGQGATAYNAIANNISNPTGAGPYPTGILGPFTPELIDYRRTWGPDNFFGPTDTGVQHGVDFADTVFARFTRTVNLVPGVYTFLTRSDDGVRLRTSVNTGMLVGGSPLVGNILINNFNDHSETEDTVVVQVTQAITTELTLEFYNKWGNGLLLLSVSLDDYSYTDSPNTPNPLAPGGFDVVTSIRYGNSSMMLNGTFDLSSAPNRRLNYDRVWSLATNQSFHIDISTNGGFTWVRADDVGAYAGSDGGESVWGNWNFLPPSNPWQRREVILPQSANVMFRFRMETIAGSSTSDGVYIDNISVQF